MRRGQTGQKLPPSCQFIDQVAQLLHRQGRAVVCRRGPIVKPSGRAWAMFRHGSMLCELVISPYSTPGLMRITGNAGRRHRTKGMLRRLGFFERCPVCHRRCKRAVLNGFDICLTSGHLRRPSSWIPAYASDAFELTCTAEELPGMAALAIEIAQGRKADHLWQVAGFEFLHRPRKGVSYLWTVAAEKAHSK